MKEYKTFTGWMLFLINLPLIVGLMILLISYNINLYVFIGVTFSLIVGYIVAAFKASE